MMTTDMFSGYIIIITIIYYIYFSVFKIPYFLNKRHIQINAGPIRLSLNLVFYHENGVPII